jgi:hypothetical protein
MTMTNIAHSSTGNARLDKSLDDIIARENRLYAAAEARGLGMADMEALAILRDTVGFLDLMSEGVAGGIAFDGPDMALAFQWTVMKLAEFNAMLPEHFRGDHDVECFLRTGAAARAAGATGVFGVSSDAVN